MDSDENYSPPDPVYYNYGVKNFLVKDISFFADTNEYASIILCVYRVNTTGKYPFLEYLLTNDGFDRLSLPIIPIFTTFSKANLISYSKVFLSGVLQVSDFNIFDSKLEFDGFYEYDKNLYLFFDTTMCDNLNHYFISNNLYFVLSDEILNHRKICNIKINEETTKFFLNNDSINYLYDKNNEAYENPIVAFVGKPTVDKINFTYTFGENSKDKLSMFGPYYYFTNFINSIRQGGWSDNYKPEKIFNKLVTDNEGRYLKGGIVRFALFMGQTKYVENSPNDENDNSEIKKSRLEDPDLDKTYETQTLRISDHDGIWTKNYDSVYLGNIELDDGSFVKEAPLFVLKEYDRQIPLSHHFIDKTKLGDKFDPDNLNYSIV